MKPKFDIDFQGPSKMVVFGCFMALGYWFIQSTIFTLMSENITFSQGVFVTDFKELVSRTVGLCFFMILASHAQYMMQLRKQAEVAQKESEGRYRTIIETIEDGYYELDIPGNFIFYNDATARILNINEEHPTGLTVNVKAVSV